MGAPINPDGLKPPLLSKVYVLMMWVVVGLALCLPVDPIPDPDLIGLGPYGPIGGLVSANDTLIGVGSGLGA